MKWVLLICGALTLTMLHTAIAPDAALRSIFGGSLEGPIADVVARSWGVLIALGGGMLIYAAFRPEARPLVLTVTGLGKLAFVALVLSHGRLFLGHQAGVAVVADSAMVLIFAGSLIRARRSRG